MCALGSVNMRRKNCVLLPAEGGRTQLFHLIFTKPGAHLIVHLCIITHPNTYKKMGMIINNTLCCCFFAADEKEISHLG